MKKIFSEGCGDDARGVGLGIPVSRIGPVCHMSEDLFPREAEDT